MLYLPVCAFVCSQGLYPTAQVGVQKLQQTEPGEQWRYCCLSRAEACADEQCRARKRALVRRSCHRSRQDMQEFIKAE